MSLISLLRRPPISPQNQWQYCLHTHLTHLRVLLVKYALAVIIVDNDNVFDRFTHSMAATVLHTIVIIDIILIDSAK